MSQDTFDSRSPVRSEHKFDEGEELRSMHALLSCFPLFFHSIPPQYKFRLIALRTQLCTLTQDAHQDAGADS
jgi:hypothetical protein